MARGDFISRKYIVKALLQERDNYPVFSKIRFNEAVRAGIRIALRIAETAPCAFTPELATWIRDPEGSTYCSKCKTYIPTVAHHIDYADDDSYDWDEEIETTRYCPHCGSKMKDMIVNEEN